MDEEIEPLFVGGNLQAGPTYNTELDTILERYFPARSWLRCDTLPNMSHAMATNILLRVISGELRYFPVYARNHWVAGVWSIKGGKPTLTLYDSAPNVSLQQEIVRQLQTYFTHMVPVAFGKCPKQLRHSADCGIYMMLNFIRAHLRKGPLPASHDLPQTVRPFFTDAVQQPPKTAFFQDCERLVWARDVPKTKVLHGGAASSSTRQNAMSKVVVAKKKAAATPKPSGTAAATPKPSGKAATTPKPSGKAATTPKPSGKAERGESAASILATQRAEVPPAPLSFVDKVCEEAALHEADAARHNLCYLLVATALTSIVNQRLPAMTAAALSTRRWRMGYEADAPMDLAEAIMKHRAGLSVYPYGRVGRGYDVLGECDPEVRVVYLSTNPGVRLPRSFRGRKFVLGGEFHGDGKWQTVGHYTVTRTAGKAVVGAYVTEETFRALTQRTTDPTQRSKRRDEPEPDGETAEAQYRVILERPIRQPLNGWGGHAGPRVRPNLWKVHQGMPDHKSAGTWAGTTRAVRSQHRRWLCDIAAMPGRLQGWPLQTAILELVRMQASARQWAPSTYSTTLGYIQSALQQLPLYTNEARPINLAKYPEWTQAINAARRIAKAIERHPSPPLKVNDYNTLRHILRQGDPETYMFATLMWQASARPADVIQLTPQRVHLGATHDEVTRVILDIREGKSAKRSGPYQVGTAISKSDAELLQKMCSRAPGLHKRIFAQPEIVKATMRRAMRALSPHYSLPSVRLGALAHWAKEGMTTADMQILAAPQGGRDSAGRRRKPPPDQEFFGKTAPDPEELGISYIELFHELRRVKGEPPLDIGPVHTWPLHLKRVTLANLDNVSAMRVEHQETQRYLTEAFEFLQPARFAGLVTSRTIKITRIQTEDITRMVDYGKVEECPEPVHHNNILRTGVHGVNLFYQPELKGRRRVITEPHLNAVIPKHSVPVLRHPSRLTTRQVLARSRYCLQVDFEAFYDAIPIPESLRNMFVFRTRDKYYRMRTVPTGARWSVAIGQAITWVITDVPTVVSIITCIDNVLIAAAEGQEQEFVDTVRSILRRMADANLLTSPPRDELLQKTDGELLSLSEEDTVFLGEEYTWTGTCRHVRNQAKTIAKLQLASQKQVFTRRSFVAFVSLLMYAMHTTRLNPSMMFDALRAYRGVYRNISDGSDWDERLPFITPNALRAYRDTSTALLQNSWYVVAPPVLASYKEQDYDYVVFIDASSAGWAAVAGDREGCLQYHQQRWTVNLGPVVPTAASNEEDEEEKQTRFQARHSAHAEPTAIWRYLDYRRVKGELQPGTRVAMVTDHMPIVAAQRKHNGFGGIGRGYHLEALFRYVNDLYHRDDVQVVFFHVKGIYNPADYYSRNFGVKYSTGIVTGVATTALPMLETCFSPMCSAPEEKAFCGDRW